MLRGTILALAAASFIIAGPIDQLESLRHNNRVEGRQAHTLTSLASAVAHIEYAESTLASTSENSTSLEKRQTQKGRATTTGGNNEGAYYGYIWPVRIRNQVLRMVFATELADFWTYGKNLPASTRQGHNVYQNTGTPVNGKTWERYASLGETYRMGGQVYNDSVSIGGYTAYQEVESANYMGSATAAETSAFEGVVGRGWATGKTGCRPYDCKQWWSTLYLQLVNGGMKSGFSIGLGSGSKPAVWDVGFVDAARYTGEMFYTQGYNARTGWDIFVKALSFGATPAKVYGGDLWTTPNPDLQFILARSDIVNAYYKKIAGAKRVPQYGNVFIYPCSAKAPAFSVFIADQGGNRQVKRSMPGSLMNVFETDEFPGQCLGALQDLVHDQLDLVLGIPFMKSQYVSFLNEGLGAPLVGFAQQT